MKRIRIKRLGWVVLDARGRVISAYPNQAQALYAQSRIAPEGSVEPIYIKK